MIGIIGGTFDPIHFGHLRPALEIAEQLSLDEIRFIPSATPPHRWQPEANQQHRLEMVKLAIASEEQFVVDEREYHRHGKSYTVDTLKEIRNEIGNDTPLCMIIGVDAFQSFTEWHEWQTILTLTHLVVSSRPGYVKTLNDDWMQQSLTKSSTELQKKPAGLLFFADVTQLDISATYIRKQRHNGKSPAYLTTQSVIDYIKRNKIYETE